MDESNFDRLLERYVTGEVTAEEKRKIEAWFAVRKTRGEENFSVSEKESEELFAKITNNIDSEQGLPSLIPPSRTSKSKTILAIGIAASILIMVSALIFFVDNNWFDRSNTTVTNRVILEDGSIVWLRGDSRFTYFEGADGTRNGSLEGEGLFEIAKDPSRPFFIRHNQYTVTVIGTSFRLRTSTDSLHVNVLTGKVRVTTAFDSSSVVLERLESASLASNATVSKGQFATKDIESLIVDTQYDMNFSNADMKSVADKLSQKFDVKFSFSNKKIANCLVTADFTDHSLESTTAMLADVLNVSFKREDGLIVIEGSGCE